MADWLSEVAERALLFDRFGRQAAPGATIVEIGVEYGVLSQQILESCPQAKLFVVDPWRYQATGYDDPCNKPQAELDEVYRQCCERLRPYGERVSVLRLTSLEAARQLAATTFDLVYIDGNHSYQAVVEDIAAWYPLVRPGGILAGHDYTENPNPTVCGVIPAVDQFVQREQLQLYHMTESYDCSWAVRKPL